MAARDGEAQLATLPVVVHAVVEAVLAGGVEHQDVHDEVQVALDEGAVAAVGLVGPLDAVQVPIGPVDVIAVLRQAEGVREVVGDHNPLLACTGTHGTVTATARAPCGANRFNLQPWKPDQSHRAFGHFGERAGSTEAGRPATLRPGNTTPTERGKCTQHPPKQHRRERARWPLCVIAVSRKQLKHPSIGKWIGQRWIFLKWQGRSDKKERRQRRRMSELSD